MKLNLNTTFAVLLAAILVSAVSCTGKKVGGPPVPPLGSGVDRMMAMQEENAEASKFVIYMHEFELNGARDGKATGYRLNSAGEDHVKQIAAALQAGAPFRNVIIERSKTSVNEDTRFKYPVHLNDHLDAKRREVVVRALVALGVREAEEIVVVAPAFAEGVNSQEAARAYSQSLRSGGGFGGFGGGFGGF